MRQTLLHLLFPVVLCVLFAISPVHGRANPNIISLTLPAEAIRQSVQSVLPLPIVPEGDHLEGRLVLASISRLEMRDNGALVQGTILGSKLILKTKVGNQLLNMRIGELRLPLTCDFIFRFDPGKKILYVKPHLVPPPSTKNPQADAVLPLLALLGDKEYPVPLDALKTFSTKVGSQAISIAMEPVDIRIAAQQMEVKMRPVLRKNR